VKVILKVSGEGIGPGCTTFSDSMDTDDTDRNDTGETPGESAR